MMLPDEDLEKLALLLRLKLGLESQQYALTIHCDSADSLRHIASIASFFLEDAHSAPYFPDALRAAIITVSCWLDLAEDSDSYEWLNQPETRRAWVSIAQACKSVHGKLAELLPEVANSEDDDGLGKTAV
jgi:hypothetical protein